MLYRKWLPQIFAFLFSLQLVGQTDSQPLPKTDKKWFEIISIGGYVQARYNRLFETNPNLGCEQCDGNWGEGNGFSLRRVRVKFSGNLGDHVYFYVQPDFASSGLGGQHYGQIRDAYFDVSIDKNREYRFRFGQSKVPFGFENMQSSQNRLPLDRNDALNSSIKNERELGLFFYWTPTHIQERFSMLTKQGFKGSGDYGVLGLGVFNGQTGNAPELNNELHVVARLTYPFLIGNQIIEPGIQGYTGKYQLPINNVSGGSNVREDLNYLDQRVAATFVLYPQPFGIQAEYNVGRGPELIQKQVLLRIHHFMEAMPCYPIKWSSMIKFFFLLRGSTIMMEAKNLKGMPVAMRSKNLKWVWNGSLSKPLNWWPCIPFHPEDMKISFCVIIYRKAVY